jgi:hypothetical protein
MKSTQRRDHHPKGNVPVGRIFGAVLLAIMSSAASAHAGGGEWHGGKDAFASGGPVLYARGCYWHRGVRRCSQYCYVEITGKRYCKEREAEAVPQGDPYAYERPSVDQIYRRPRD